LIADANFFSEPALPCRGDGIDAIERIGNRVATPIPT
jgi:hypothetical protein